MKTWGDFFDYYVMVDSVFHPRHSTAPTLTECPNCEVYDNMDTHVCEEVVALVLWEDTPQYQKMMMRSYIELALILGD